MKQFSTRYITVYFCERTYGGPEEGGWSYYYKSVEKIIPYRSNKARIKAIAKAKDICDKYNEWSNSDSEYMDYYDENKYTKGQEQRIPYYE